MNIIYNVILTRYRRQMFCCFQRAYCVSFVVEFHNHVFGFFSNPSRRVAGGRISNIKGKHVVMYVFMVMYFISLSLNCRTWPHYQSNRIKLVSKRWCRQETRRVCDEWIFLQCFFLLLLKIAIHKYDMTRSALRWHISVLNQKIWK